MPWQTAVAHHPDRFQALVTLPVGIPDEAAQELNRYVRTLSVKGTMLCGRVGHRKLDYTDLLPIF